MSFKTLLELDNLPLPDPLPSVSCGLWEEEGTNEVDATLDLVSSDLLPLLSLNYE